jgi:polygalacturonase
MNKRSLSAILVALLWTSGTAAASFTAGYDVRSFGAKPDGETLCTHAIQNAVDQCARDGGGTVYFPPGTWLSGTVYLSSHVTVWLDAGCTLLGSKEKSHYGHPRRLGGVKDETFSYWAILAGKDIEHVAIRGDGTIDGQGAYFKYRNGRRPKNIYLENCSDVLIEGVRMRDAGCWMQHYRKCNRLTIRDISVFNHIAYNNDGLNVDSCRDVVITGCMVDSDDDAIVLKSLSKQPCENVTISDCVISSHCNSIKMGTESGGGFQNVTVTNCVICSPRYSAVIYGRQRGLAGLALEVVDGGTLDRVAISNITIRGVTVPIFMRLGNRARPYEKGQAKPGIGRFQNVIVSNVIADDCSSIGCSISGLPNHPIENVTLSNISLGFEGGGGKEDASRKIPENPASYPESTMFGALPAYGFFCRHVKGLRLDNVRLRTAKADKRHALVCEDVADLTVDNLDADHYPGGEAMLRFTDVVTALVRGCGPKAGTGLFLRLEGSSSKRVVLMANDFSNVKSVVQVGSDVPETAAVEVANVHSEERR